MRHTQQFQRLFIGITTIALALAMPPLFAAPPDGGNGHGGGGGGGGGQPPADPAITYVDSGQIMVMNADGSNQTAVYTGGIVYTPCWSPDGSAIAFMEGWSIWRIDVDVVSGVPQGSNFALVLSGSSGGPASYSRPKWSPDGSEIIAHEINSGTIVSAPAAGGSPTIVYASPEGNYASDAAFSPDGAYIAFFESDGPPIQHTYHSIRVLERMSGQVTTVLDPQGQDQALIFLDWARTQDVLAFAMEPGDGHRHIYTLDLSTPNAVPQLIALDRHSPTWSPDDSKLAFSSFGRRGRHPISVFDFVTQQTMTLVATGDWPDWKR